MNTAPEMFEQLGMAVALGLVVGLQRQRTSPTLPGVRTFPLITVFGALLGNLSDPLGGWIVAVGLLCVAALAVLSQVLRLRSHPADLGTTTDIAALVMYGVGVLLAVGPMQVAVAIGGGVAVLLHLKPEMHSFAERLGSDDVKAIMQFVAITCIVLPVMPNRAYDCLGVLNPFETWLMVVLIVGMSLAGYIVYKFFGRDAGILLGGVLGGLISSTATTVSYARQARDEQVGVRPVAVVILIATTLSFLRVFAAAAVVARDCPRFLAHVAAPMLILAALSLIPSLLLWRRVRKDPPQMALHQNPSELRSALLFGVMYAAVLFALAAAKRFIGPQALYVVAGLSGLTDLDAITLSTARMAIDDPQMALGGWRLIVVAALANLVSKAALAGLLGGRRLMWEVALLFAIPTVGGIALLVIG